MRRQKPRRIGVVLRFCVIMVVSLTTTFFRREWRNGDRIPAEGPAIIVVNHVSYADPFVMARFAWDNGRIPRFLGKSTLFGLPVIGRLLRAAGQIPVYRGTIDAARSLDAAVADLRRGQVVVMYPEGTVTREPDFWPKAGKTGAARLALLAPEVPMLAVAQWGAQDAVDFYNHRYRLLPRKTVTVSVGAQLDLHRYIGEPPTADTLREMTELIMKAITDELSNVRGIAPAQPHMRAAVLGAGSWGTAFAKILADAGTETTLWVRRAELAAAIDERHENPDYLPGILLPTTLRATHDPGAALAGADIVAFAVPAQVLRPRLGEWAALLPPAATLVSLMKGIELGSAKRMSEVIAEVTGADPARVAVVSGPNLAHEVALQQPTATVVACSDEGRARAVQAACSATYFRPYTNSDVVGCELGGALKNVIALACGMTIGMGFGDNTVASLMTRGLAETARLGVTLGADPLTFAGLAGMGDLVATCASPLSRNRSFGECIGRGESLEQAESATHGQVVEGVKSCRSILELARRHGVDVPITAAVEQVCFANGDPAAMVAQMMARSRKSEQEE